MQDDRLPLLTKNQRDYLRLVHAGLTSKQIAQRTGGSHHTVNVEVASAARLLGARNRAEAAALLARAEHAGSYEPSYEPPHVADATDPASFRPRGAVAAIRGGFPLPVPTAGKPLNDLTASQRLFWILALAAVAALILGGLVSGIVALLDGLGRRI